MYLFEVAFMPSVSALQRGENSSNNEEDPCQTNNVDGVVSKQVIYKVLHAKNLNNHGNDNKHIKNTHIDPCFIARDGRCQHLIRHGHHRGPSDP